MSRSCVDPNPKRKLDPTMGDMAYRVRSRVQGVGYRLESAECREQGVGRRVC